MCTETLAQLDEKQMEVLAMLSEELSDSTETFQHLATEMRSEECFADSKESYLQQLSFLKETADMLGLNGLVQITGQIATNIKLIENSEAFSDALFTALKSWPNYTLSYLEDPLDDGICLALLAQLEMPCWPKPTTCETSKTLLQQLANIEITDLDEGEGSKDSVAKTEVTDEDIVLTPADDINQEVLASFLQDAPNQAEELFEHLSLLGIDSREENREHINIAQRVSHTLKGSANLINIKAVANISHELERILETFTETDALPSNSDRQLMVNAADCMSAMIDYLLGRDQAPENIKTVLVALSQWTYSGVQDQECPAPIEVLTEVPPSIDTPVSSKSSPHTELKANNGDLAVDEMLGLAENMNINMVQSKELYKRIVGTLDTVKLQELKIQERRFDLENRVDSRSMATPQIQFNKTSEIDLDPLEMDRYDEIHLSTHEFIEAVSDSREITQKLQDQLVLFDSLIQQQQRYTDSVQHLILKSKQIPVSQYNSRLQRCVRQASQMAKKELILIITGDTVAIDKDMMNQLIDALMHLIRNAVDHGVESPENRIAANKPLEGSIKLNFSSDGQQLTISSSDDGQGLDYQAIYQAALSKGLIPEQSEQPSNEALSMLLFESGFTTRSQATQLSGRGIGLDAVKSTIESLGGKISVESHESEGTTFTLVIPMKQVSQHLVIVMVNFQRYAIASNTIKQILSSVDAQHVEVAGEYYIEYGDRLFSYQPMGSLINKSISTNNEPEYTSSGALLLVEVDSKAIAIEVDQLLNSYDLVIKKTGTFMKELPGIDGISILGDGALVPVLNIKKILTQHSTNSSRNSESKSLQEPVVQAPQILVVDDSLSVRSSLKQLLSDVGYQVETANDGVDAVDKMASITPTIVLVDMEMPRMNGLELTQYIRHQDNLKHIPVIMLTSRSQQKHRDLAEKSGVSLYKTKPYSEFDLLDAIQKTVQEGAAP